jgi:hypothetical protein
MAARSDDVVRAMTYYAHFLHVGGRLLKDSGSGPRGCVAMVAGFASGAHLTAFGQVFQVVEIALDVFCVSDIDRLIRNGTSVVRQTSKSRSWLLWITIRSHSMLARTCETMCRQFSMLCSCTSLAVQLTFTAWWSKWRVDSRGSSISMIGVHWLDLCYQEIHSSDELFHTPVILRFVQEKAVCIPFIRNLVQQLLHPPFLLESYLNTSGKFSCISS